MFRRVPSNNIIPFALSNITPRKRGRAGVSATAVQLRESPFGLSLSKALFSPLPSWERARVRVMPRRRREQLLESLSKGNSWFDKLTTNGFD